MPKIAYIARNFTPATQAVIDLANTIILEYAYQGFSLTLRQLYYQLVARGHIPNRDTEYKRLGAILNDARLAGLVDWEAIEDRTRNLRENSHWTSPVSIARDCVSWYQTDRWRTQPTYVEVWIEKDALVGVLAAVCPRLDVPYFSCRGYTSASEMWRAAQRFVDMDQRGKDCVLLHLGDHDPSGIDMTRDIDARLDLFCEGSVVQVRRIALTQEQIARYAPPPNPAKVTDSRYAGYRREYGDESWELDALEPRVLVELIETEVGLERDEAAWEAAVAQEERHRAALREAVGYLADRRATWDGR